MGWQEDLLNKKLEVWQERVIQEKKELDEKISKLQDFLDNPIQQQGVAREEIVRLYAQNLLMVQYSAILGARITSWSQTSAT
jgi:DNA primase large subunit